MFLIPYSLGKKQLVTDGANIQHVGNAGKNVKEFN